MLLVGCRFELTPSVERKPWSHNSKGDGAGVRPTVVQLA